jgi:hypothetical protein
VKEGPTTQVIVAEGERRVERKNVIVKYRRFGGKKTGRREGRQINIEDCHPKSQGDRGQPFSAPFLKKC